MLVEAETLARRLRETAEVYELESQFLDGDHDGEAQWRGIVAVTLYAVACAVDQERHTGGDK